MKTPYQVTNREALRQEGCTRSSKSCTAAFGPKRSARGQHVAFVLVLGVGLRMFDCGEPPIDRVVPTVPGELGLGFQSDVVLADWSPPDVLKGVNHSFDEAAGVISATVGTTLVDPPSGGTWPESEAQLEGAHASNSWDFPRDWHVYFATTLGNQTGCSNRVLGRSRTRFHDVFPDLANRWSYVFVDEIRAVKQLCAGYTNVSLTHYVTAVAGHELGHQRRGLLHNDGGAYHVIGFPDDLMNPLGPSPSKMASTIYYSFCRNSAQSSNDDFETSCGSILFALRSASAP